MRKSIAPPYSVRILTSEVQHLKGNRVLEASDENCCQEGEEDEKLVIV
jgi:hypothetical protein